MLELRIDELQPASASRTHLVAAMLDGRTDRLAIGSILSQILRDDLPPDVEEALAKAESALQSLLDDAVTTEKIADSNVTNAKLADMAQATVKGRASGAGSGAPVDLSATDLFSILDTLVPPKPTTAAGVGKFQSWSVGAGTGYSAPTGGTWLVVWISFNAAGGTLYGGFVSAIAAGGSVVQPGVSGVQHTGFSWRIL
ncbi:MAG: hypothetical protein KJ947_11555 [Alphaproteobacteria bacterium]|nr:hypothetical protein [Alphaproteobacteria bacterium]MBU1550192.1 hypothetical protein [Alphaproteobacteria bacterium]MBU2337887.1 hypothetical protein [Alphaproteobacteria bacterium]MBU2387867.1 hypothetical protein [Alphaproteobacteria bacterium]